MHIRLLYIIIINMYSNYSEQSHHSPHHSELRKLRELYSDCTLCPRACHADRMNKPNGSDRAGAGRCGMGPDALINTTMLHYGEEPVISGSRGSGAVFFEGCSLGCIFCQNYRISRGRTGRGQIYTAEEMARLFLNLQEQGAHNINLVTGMHFAPSVIEAAAIARDMGLTLPIAANCSGYESVETLKLLAGTVDIYLPDFKFWDEKLSYELCGARDYREKCISAIEEMFRQTGSPVSGSDGTLTRGVIVRHLMLPGKLFDTRKILDHLALTYGNEIYISLMNQYTPMPQLEEEPLRSTAPAYLRRRLNPGHYATAADYLSLLGQTNCFIQEGDASGDEMIPDFR